MKKFVLSIIIAAGGLLTQTASAQVGISVGFHIGPVAVNMQRPVARTVLYDDYYYLPDVEAYYSVPERCYYYMDDNREWVSGAYLPGRYRNFDWRSARRYEVRSARPYQNHDFYRNKWGGNRGGSNWRGDDAYAYNRNDRRRDDRGNYGGGRIPDSPYDSNNGGWGRNGRDNNRNNNWNNSRGNDNNYQPQRGNDSGFGNNGYGRGQNNGDNGNNNGRGQYRGDDGGSNPRSNPAQQDPQRNQQRNFCSFKRVSF